MLYALAYLDRQVVTLLVGPIKADLGATDFQISLVQGFAFVGFYVLCALPIGWAVDRFSRRLIVFVGILTWSLSAMAGGLSRTYWQLLVSRFGVGAGEAALSPAAYSSLSDLFPKERLAGAMAIFSTGAIIGGAISLGAGGLIVGLAAAGHAYVLPVIGEVKPWQLVFLLSGAPGVFLAFLVFLVHEPKRTGRAVVAGPKAASAGFGPALGFVWARKRFYLLHFAGFSLLNIMTGAWSAWAPTLYVRTLGWSIPRVGLALGAVSLVCGASGMLFSGHFVDHLHRRGVHDAHLRYYVYATMVMGAAGVGAGLLPLPPLMLACTAVISLISPFIAVCGAALQITTPNQYRGQVTAMFLICYNIVGFGVGPMIAAGFTDFLFHDDRKIGWALALTFALFAPIVATTFRLGYKPMRRAVLEADAWR